MKTFHEILVEDAEQFLIAELDVETVVYVKAASVTPAQGTDLETMATAGVLMGEPASMAVAGVIEAGTPQSEQRSISALVNRKPPENFSPLPQGTAPRILVTVKNDNSSGISSTEINTGKDTIKLAMRIGQTPQQRRITRIISQDVGMMVLEVR